MALAVDASSPAIVTGALASTATTASFSPPASVLVACMWGNDSGTAATFSAPTHTVATLTWNLAIKQNRSDTGGQGGNSTIYYAILSSSASGMTVTCHYSSSDVALKVYAVTGADMVTPLGATQHGSKTGSPAAFTTAAFTTLGANSMEFGTVSDFNTSTTAPTSSDLTYVNAAISTRMYGAMGFKTLGGVGTSATATYTMGSTSSLTNWVAAEIKAATSSVLPRNIGNVPVMRAALR